MKLSDIDQTLRNPIYPGALRLCDIKEGVGYRCINCICGYEQAELGIFSSEPYISTSTYSDESIVASNDEGEIVHLSDMGVAKYGLYFWNPVHFTIENTPDEISVFDNWCKNGGEKIIANYAREHLEACRLEEEMNELEEE